MPSHTRPRGWCFTLNNPTQDEINQVSTVPCRYIIFGHEIGENGTPHLQGYVHFKEATTFTRAKALLPRCHLEPRRGSPAQAIRYCKKDGLYTEIGESPVAANKWSRIIELSEKGYTNTIRQEYPDVYFKCAVRIKSMRVREPTIIEGDLTNEWWVGHTGTGKSKSLWRLYPDHYQKTLNKWWDGYQDEDIVAIEEWSPKNDCTGSQLKIWADRYPFSAEVKGGTLSKIRPKKIIVLSNYDIATCFTDSRDNEPLLRRFQVFRFPDDLSVIERRAREYHSQRLALLEEHAEKATSLEGNSCESDVEDLTGGDECEESAQSDSELEARLKLLDDILDL